MAEDRNECCDRCGARLPAGRLEGLCPVCLLEDSHDLFELEVLPEEDEELAPPPPCVKSRSLLNLRGYAVLREIDRGGMGIVYEALQVCPERRVALKMLLPHLLDRDEMRERFRREAQAMSSLDHPGVLPVYEVGEHCGLPFFCMKLAPGGSLQQRVGEYRGRWREIATLVAHLADAVQCAHDHGLLHRDLKPGNILFDETGKAYVTDFGLAKRTDAPQDALSLTRTTTVLGTPHYLAPEWAAGTSRTATTAGDVYGLGAILYFLLTGRPPYHKSDCLPALLKEIAETSPAPLGQDTPRDLGIICLKAMEKEPARRYASAAALADDLRRWLEGRPILARPASAGEKLWRLAKRNPLSASLATALALAVTVGGAALVNSWRIGRERLHFSLVAQAAVMRETAQLEHRSEALEVLSEAAVFRGSRAAREEMTSALAMPEWREVRRVSYDDRQYQAERSRSNSGAPPGDAAHQATGSAFDRSPPAVDPGFTRYVYFGKGGRVIVRSLEDGREICRLPRDIVNPQHCGPFSPDGRWLCVRPDGQSMMIWDCEEKRWQGKLVPGRSPVFEPGSGGIVTAGDRDVWRSSLDDLSKGKKQYSPGLDSVPRTYAFCPRGERMIVGERDSTRFKILNMLTGGEEFQGRNPPAAGPRCAAWHPDGQSVFVGAEDSRIYRWPLLGESVPEVFDGHFGPVMALAVDPSGDWMVSQAKDGLTRLWSTVTGKTVATLPFEGGLVMMKTGRNGEVRVICENRRERQLVEFSLSPSPVCRQFTVPHRPRLDRASKGCWNVVFSPDGGLLSVGDMDGVWHFHPETGKPLGCARVGPCWSLGWQRDGGAFYSASDTGLQRWEVLKGDDGGAELLPPGAPWATGRLHHLSLSQDGKLLALARDHCVELYQVPEGVLLRRIASTDPAENNFVDMISLCPGSRHLAIGRGKERRASIWKTDTGELLRGVPTLTEEPVVLFSEMGGHLFVADPEKLICSDFKTGRTTWGRLREKLAGGTLALAQSPDGRLVAVTLGPEVVHILDAVTGREYARLRHPFPERVSWMAFSPDGGRLAVLCLRRQVQLWDLRELRRRLAEHELDWNAPPFPPPVASLEWRVPDEADGPPPPLPPSSGE